MMGAERPDPVILDEILRFVREDVMWAEGDRSLTPDTPLLAGLLDSIALETLVSFLEERYGIVVENTELVMDNFRSPSAIAELVGSKVREAGG
jgi:acyl carrier protein